MERKILIMLLLPVIIGISFSTCNPPTMGDDWNISSVEYCSDQTINLTGNLSAYNSSANLILDNVTLYFNLSSPQEFYIYFPFGNLTINESTSIITPNVSWSYVFNSSIDTSIEDSSISHLYNLDIRGNNTVLLQNNTFNQSGLIEVWDNNKSSIIRNNRINSSVGGLLVKNSSSTLIFNNTIFITGDSTGINLSTGGEHTNISYNQITGSTIIANSFGINLEGGGSYIKWVNISHNTFKSLGLAVATASNVIYTTISYNVISYSNTTLTGWGAINVGTNNNTIYSNIITNHSSQIWGIQIGGYWNDVHNNSISMSSYDFGGIALGQDWNNVTNNTIWGVQRAVHLGANSRYNTLYNNNFTASGLIAVDKGGDTKWNTSKDCTISNILGGNCTGGNYFSNYTANDSNFDGIGDSSYIIPGDGGGVDYLPLMLDTNLSMTPIGGYSINMFSDETITRTFNVTNLVSKSTVSPLQYCNNSVGAPLSDFVTFNESDYTVINGSIHPIIITITKPFPVTYTTNIVTTCNKPFQQTNTTHNISLTVLVGARGGGGGGGGGGQIIITQEGMILGDGICDTEKGENPVNSPRDCRVPLERIFAEESLVLAAFLLIGGGTVYLLYTKGSRRKRV